MTNDNIYFNPSCDLRAYKPDKIDLVLNLIKTKYKSVKLHNVCCRTNPRVENGSMIINLCPACDKNFRTLYKDIKTISLWEVLDSMDDLKLPNYNGEKVTIQDPCTIRDRGQIHDSIRSLLKKMNLETVEAQKNKEKTICCGDIYRGRLPEDKVIEKMKKRADDMPCREVVVYCLACKNAMFAGEKSPRHILDLIINENTIR